MSLANSRSVPYIDWVAYYTTKEKEKEKDIQPNIPLTCSAQCNIESRKSHKPRKSKPIERSTPRDIPYIQEDQTTDATTHKGGDTVGGSDTEADGLNVMGSDIQLVSPVQTAVNQAMAIKRRRASKKKSKTGTKAKRKKRVGGVRKRKPKKKQTRKKKKKRQRDIFNY